MKRIFLSIIAGVFFTTVMSSAAHAGEFVYPKKNPDFSVPIPSSWKAEVNDYGFTANPKNGNSVEVAYFVVEGDDALEEATDGMKNYIDESWTNVEEGEDKSIDEGGRTYHMISMSGTLKADKSEKDSIQIWIYTPAPKYAAYAVLSVGVDEKNTDKYIDQFVEMLTETKTLAGGGAASDEDSGSEE